MAASIALASITWFAEALAQAPDSTAAPQAPPATTAPQTEATPPAGAAPATRGDPASGAAPAQAAAGTTEAAKGDPRRAGGRAERIPHEGPGGALTHYEWVETTTVLKGGEEKSKSRIAATGAPTGSSSRSQ